MITHKTGNIFTTQAHTIVNTINCVGVMGAGIAFEFKLREPEMFKQYQQFCENKQITTGKLWVYQSATNDKQAKYQKILNFPTKNHWKYPSKKEYLEKGLQNFVASYQARGIQSIAFPLLGADKGGLNPKESQQIMEHYLNQCDIPVEIWQFDPKAKDDLYDSFVKTMNDLNDNQLKAATSLRADKIKLLRLGIQKKQINSLSALLREKGIGEKTLQKTFALITDKPSTQPTLF